MWTLFGSAIFAFLVSLGTAEALLARWGGKICSPGTAEALLARWGGKICSPGTAEALLARWGGKICSLGTAEALLARWGGKICSPGTAEALLARWGGKICRLLIDEFLYNVSVKNYQHRLMHIKVIAIQRWALCKTQCKRFLWHRRWRYAEQASCVKRQLLLLLADLIDHC